MSITKNVFSKQSEYTATYSNMRGVDFNASLKNAHTRFAYLQNLYRDYDNEAGRIESIPGFRSLAQMPDKIPYVFLTRGCR